MMKQMKPIPKYDDDNETPPMYDDGIKISF